MSESLPQTTEPALPAASEMPPATPLTAWTWLLYLLFDPQAVRQIAATPQALWLGLAWVLLAGIAREYDGEDLLRESWHLLLPLGASLVTSTILYLVLRVCLMVTPENNTEHYRGFVSLYWLTAPLAWLYAIPVERFLTAGGATGTNLWLLLLVSVWRVSLMVHVTRIHFRTTAIKALFPILLFADLIALALLISLPMPLLSLMGGIRLSESARMIQGATFDTIFLGVLSIPVWAVGSLVVLSLSSGESRRVPRAEPLPLPRSVWWWPVGMFLLGLVILPAPQREQQLRRQAERLLRSGQIEQGLHLMSAHAPGDFPPHWDPPPVIDYPNWTPPLLDVLEALDRAQPAEWVRAEYTRKFEQWIDVDGHFNRWYDEPGALDRILSLLEGKPDLRTRFLHKENIENTFRDLLQSDPDDQDDALTPEHQQQIKALFQLEQLPLPEEPSGPDASQPDTENEQPM